MNATTPIPQPESAEDQIPETTTAEDRDSRGRFAKGNSGGPGNPFGRQVATLRKVLLSCVSEEDMAAIGNKLVEMAKNGNIQAIKLLFSYTLGKPTEGVQPDRVDMEEWELFKLLAEIPKEADEVALVPDHGLALTMARTMRPVLSQLMTDNFKEDIEQDREKVLRREERRKQNKILREQRRAQKEKGKNANPGSSNGHPAQPAPNDSVPPSTNGKLSPETAGPPSTNGFFGDKLSPGEPEVFNSHTPVLQNPPGSLLPWLTGRRGIPNNGKNGHSSR